MQVIPYDASQPPTFPSGTWVKTFHKRYSLWGAVTPTFPITSRADDTVGPVLFYSLSANATRPKPVVKGLDMSAFASTPRPIPSLSGLDLASFGIAKIKSPQLTVADLVSNADMVSPARASSIEAFADDTGIDKTPWYPMEQYRPHRQGVYEVELIDDDGVVTLQQCYYSVELGEFVDNAEGGDEYITDMVNAWRGWNSQCE